MRWARCYVGEGDFAVENAPTWPDSFVVSDETYEGSTDWLDSG